MRVSQEICPAFSYSLGLSRLADSPVYPFVDPESYPGVQGTIYASLDIMASPFIPTHFEVGIEEFAGTAVRLASLLRDEFSWRFTETGATPHVIQ